MVDGKKRPYCFCISLACPFGVDRSDKHLLKWKLYNIITNLTDKTYQTRIPLLCVNDDDWVYVRLCLLCASLQFNWMEITSIARLNIHELTPSPFWQLYRLIDDSPVLTKVLVPNRSAGSIQSVFLSLSIRVHTIISMQKAWPLGLQFIRFTCCCCCCCSSCCCCCCRYGCWCCRNNRPERHFTAKPSNELRKQILI